MEVRGHPRPLRTGRAPAIVGRRMGRETLHSSSAAGALAPSRRCAMPRAFACLMVLMLAAASTIAAPPDDTYRLGPDSEPHEGVPQGKVIGPIVLPSQVYPNTTRHYWVYVPAQYDPSRPACPHDLLRRPCLRRPAGQLPDPLRVRQPDLPARDARHDRRLHQPRPHGRSEGVHRCRVGRSHQQPPRRIQRAGRQVLQAHRRRAAAGREEGIQHLDRTRKTARSPGPARGRSARSPWPGTGPTSSGRSSARSAASPTSWAVTSIPT